MADLTLEDLKSKSSSLLALGAAVARKLIDNKQATIFVNQDGIIELAEPSHVALDALPEEIAIQHLLKLGVPEDEIARYLEGRDSRSISV